MYTIPLAHASDRNAPPSQLTTPDPRPQRYRLPSHIDPRSLACRRRASIAFILAILVLCGNPLCRLSAQTPSEPALAKPQPAPLPPAIEAPRDTPFPGTIHLQVDATDVTHRLYRLRETIPVAHAGAMTLLFPQWSPGDHSPNGPLDKLAGLTMSSGGRRLHWRRDPIQVYAFHVDLPAASVSLELEYQYVSAVLPNIGSVLVLPSMLDLEWQDVVLYPAGYFARDLTFSATVTLPAGWKSVSALDSTRTADTLHLAPVSLETLVDSPVMAARYLKQIVLTNDPVPVRLDIAADDPAALEATPEWINGYKNLVAQSYKLFGAHHFDHYDFLLWLSASFGPAYYEHHRSGENSFSPDLLTQPFQDTVAYHGFLAHGYVHTWNGMFRVPAGMWTPNLNTPQQDALLWVFEGLTSYWEDVLTARAGLWSRQNALDAFATLAIKESTQPATAWRPLEDVSYEPIIEGRGPQSWPSWQRDLFDSYQQGELIWLDIDTLIRQQTSEKKSLDDFARLFFGAHDGSFEADPYTLEDMVAALNQVMPFDWNSFLTAKLEDYSAASSTDGLQRGGYHLIEKSEPTPYSIGREASLGAADLRSSVGLLVDKAGSIAEVTWNGPAYQAGVIAGGSIATVDGQPFSITGLKEAIQRANGGNPIKLTVKRGKNTYSFAITWSGGLRYAAMERVPGTPPLLEDILAARQ